MTDPTALPRYGRIKRDLLRQIQEGVLKPGDRVPGEFALAAHYGVSRTSSRLALRDLAMEGYLMRGKGTGSVVASASPRGRVDAACRKPTFAFMLPAELTTVSLATFAAFTTEAACAGYQVLGVPFPRHGQTPELAWERGDAFAGVITWLDGGVCVPPHVPQVRICARTQPPEADTVTMPHAALASGMSAELVHNGHRRVGLLTDPGELGDACEQACQQALRRTGLRLAGTVRSRSTALGATMAGLVTLLAQPRRPTALVSTVDGAADGLVEALRRLGYEAPGDFTLATVDNHAGRTAWHGIGATYAPSDVARKCLELLVRRAAQPAAAPEAIVVQGQLCRMPATVHALPTARARAAIDRASGWV